MRRPRNQELKATRQAAHLSSAVTCYGIESLGLREIWLG